MPRTATFGTLSIDFDDRVLEPRPWTAAQSTWAADLMRGAPAGPVLEVCAGAGHIGLLAIAPRAAAAGQRRPRPGGVRLHQGERRRAGLADRVEVREGRAGRRARAGRALRADHRRPAVGAARGRPAATPRTRCWPSTAATTASTSRAPAWRSPTATCSTAGRRCSSSAPSRRCARLTDETSGRSRLRVRETRSVRARGAGRPGTPGRDTA